MADVKIRINDSVGNSIIETTTDGPWLLTKPPSGNYTITAIFKGKQQKRVVEIGVGFKNIFFHWE